MADKVLKLADKATSNLTWSPLDALKQFVKDLEDGTAIAEEIIIIYRGQDQRGTLHQNYYLAGVEQDAHGAMLLIAQHDYLRGRIIG